MNTTQEITETEGIEGGNGHVAGLLDHHLAELRQSGLSDATILAAKIFSETDHVKLASMLNRRRWDRKQGPGLVFPFIDATGATVLYRIKPDRPPVKNGRPCKYLSPVDGGVRVYFPPGVHEIVDDADVRLCVTEGEKKAACLTQHGIACVGLCGVDCWHAKHSSALLPDLARINWMNRSVFIVFDSDAIDNENVKDNERLLAAALKNCGADVRVVRLPPTADGERQGVDDYIVSAGMAAFHQLIGQAEEPEPPEPGESMESAKNMNPADEAEHLLAKLERNGIPRLRYWLGSFWLWSKGQYVEKSTDEIRAKVVNHLNQHWLFVKATHVSDVIEHLRAKSIIRSTIQPPTWLDRSPDGFNPVECLATKNKILHLPSLVDRQEPSAVDATPAFFTSSATQVEVDLNAPRPDKWLWFLDSIWSDDRQCIDTLQEIFGYCLVVDTRQHKIFLLVGPKRSGKGTIGRVLTALVGNQNVAAPTLSGMATNFGLWPLIGKSVAIISDARLSGRPDQAAIVERLLSISGEDSLTIDRKNMQPITCRLPTRFLILTNELPRLSDASGAITSRMILLQSTRSFYGQEDHFLMDKLLPELPSILLWSIEGWRRLRERGRFVQPDSGLESLGELNDLASPVTAFVRDCCEIGPVELVAVTDVFLAWQAWCKEQGREKYVGTVQTFGRDLLAAMPGIRRKRPREGDERTRVYEGIGLKPGF